MRDVFGILLILMDSVVSNLCTLASSRLSRSSDLTQGRKGERDTKLRDTPAFFQIREETTVSDHRKHQNYEFSTIAVPVVVVVIGLLLLMRRRKE